MNKKLISFLAATAMIVTVSQESMALVGEAVSNGNVAIEQEMESDDDTPEAEVADSQDAPEGNKAEDTQVSATNAVEVSTWEGLKNEISNATENVEKTIILVNDVKAEANKPITIDKGKKITIVGKKGDSGVVIERGTREPDEGEFVVNENGQLTISGKITIKSHDTDDYYKGVLTTANFIKVNNGGFLNVNGEITASTNKNGSKGDCGLVCCDGEMEINNNAKIYGWITSSGTSSKQAAVLVNGKNAKLTMNGGEISGNYNTGSNNSVGVAVQVRDGAKFIMNGGKIKENGIVPKGNSCNIWGSGVYITGEESTFTMNSGEISDNYGKFGAGIYANNQAKLNINSGIITGNKIPYNGNDSYGGGIYADNVSLNIGKDGKVEISNNGVTEFGNEYILLEATGAGIYIKDSSGTIRNTTISKNTTSGNNRQGGAGAYFENSNITMENSIIKENQAGDATNQVGGGITVKDSEINLKNVSIKDNKVSPNGRNGFIGLGGGIFIWDSNSKVTLEDCNVSGNVASNLGAGIFMNAGSVNIKGDTKIEKNKFESTDNSHEGYSKGILVAKGSNLSIEGDIYLDKEDDICLDTDDTHITVLNKLSKLNGENPISITSVDENIEDEKTEGTKLVEYSDAAGGESEALNATLGKYFIPSKYMNPDLKIGQSQKTKNILTYVKELPTGGGGTGGGTVTPNPNPTPTPDPKPEEPDRIEGNDRIETSVETSKDLYPNGTNAVVLANAERYTDVLTADPFAIQEKASALLTYKYELPEKTLKEIERLGAKKIYISGGYEAVSKKVVDELAAKGYEIFRFDGVDRYDTARKIAIKIREKGNTNAAELASGEDFPDALCMTPLAVKDRAPILLTKKDSIPKYTKQALAEWDIENIKIGGLEKAVSPEVEKQLKSGFEIEKNNKKDSNVYDGAKAVKRIGGEDRYETSAKLAKESYPESKLGVYATGEDFPDALIAGNYAGTKEAPVLLVKGDSLPEPIEKYTKESKIKKATIIGGVNAVSDKVFNLIKAIINR